MKHTFQSTYIPRMPGAWAIGFFIAALATPLSANPTGGSVAAGSAAIAGEGTSKVTINQASNIAIINWQTFSINAGESTTFLQPSAQSAALNRVLGGQTSIINGTLTANGQIYLINGNGIVVGPGGVISAGAFTASTRNISDSDFLSGNLHFTGSNNAGVQNYGTIKALGGNVVLIGKTVDNAGTINAPNGTAGLVAGDDVLLAQKNADGSTITVSPDPLATSANGQVGVKNSGTITAAAAELKAANGNIYALAVQNEGTIRATTVQKQGGRIWLTSDSGTVGNSGTLNASATAAGGKGGTVTLKSATGTASHTGWIIALGGQGGAGGNAEISGAQVQFTGVVDLTAPGGATGSLLLDPDTLEIVASGGTGTIGSLPPTGDTSINASDLVTALNGANITLQANVSISVNAPVDASSNTLAGNLILNTPTLNLSAGIALHGSSTLSGTATTVNVGASGLIQNAVDASSTTSAPTISLATDATYGLTKEIVIGKSLTLDGNGSILDGSNGAGAGNGVTRVMEIDGTSAGITVDLDGLTLENGNGMSSIGAAGGTLSNTGGALLVYATTVNKATVTITDSTLSDNSTGYGGAIYNDGESGGNASVTITDSTLSGNSAVDGSGGGINNDGGASGNATLTITGSTLSDNTVASGPGGGIYNYGASSGNATLMVTSSTFSGNSATYGGGIYNDGEGSVTATVAITGSTFSDNVATVGYGGGIDNDGGSGQATLRVTDSTLSGNSAIFGGGINNYGESGGNGTVTITGSTLSDNSANYGGGIFNNGSRTGAATVTITDSTLSGNTAASNSGGGIYNDGEYSGDATVTITASTLSDDSATYGGGIYNDGTNGGGATLTIGDSTFSGNSATYGGGIYNNGSAAGGNAALTVTSSTLSGNMATSGAGGGIYNDGSSGGTATLTIGDTILAGNTHSGAESDYASNAGTLVDHGYNLYGQNGVSGGFTPGLDVTTDILLGVGVFIGDVLDPTLADNGGPTETLALVLNSPAIDTGDPALIGTADQRGIIRGSPAAGTGSASDIGAYELAIIDVTADDQEIGYGQPLPTLTYTVTSGPTGQLTGSLALITPETDAGTYVGDIGQGTLAPSSTTYLLNFTAGTLKIDKALLTVAVNSGGTSQYGTTPIDPGIAVTSGMLYHGDTLSGLGLGDDFNLTATSNVGPYTINVTGYSGLANYTVTPVSATYVITPATLVYVANPVSRNVGQPNPVFTGTVTGFVNGQTLGSATTGTLVFTSPATVSSPAGSYAIDGSGLTANFGNYVFVQAPGNSTALTVGSLPVVQPSTQFSNFSAQFNANAGYNAFFTQNWFPLFDPMREGWLIPVFPPGNEPHPVYSNDWARYAGKEKKPWEMIAFGSSFTLNGQGGKH